MQPRSSASRGALLALVVAVTAASAPCPASTTPSSLVLVLDASGSMWGEIDGDDKIVIARRVLAGLIAELPEGIDTALVAYGHRRAGDCDDVETVVPLGALDRGRLSAAVAALNPKGMTPLSTSVGAAIDIIRDAPGTATVILVSDGLETCSGDPCAVVREARASGVDFVLHVVGFGIDEGDVSQLECAAQAGGGLYFGADDADELAAALTQAVAPPVAVDATLAVRSVLNGEPVDTLVRVTSRGEDVAAGRTYTGPDTNPRVFGLPAGVYDIEVAPVRVQGALPVRFPDLALAAGDAVERTADFSAGELAVRVTRNGELSDATVNAYRAGTRERVAGGRSYTDEATNPRVVSLTPGSWDVEVKSVEIAGGPVQRWESVAVAAGARTDLTHDFASGVLWVGATGGGELVDAAVSVLAVADGTQVVGGRTYTDERTNPKQFVLPPGSYRVRGRPVRLQGAEPLELTVTITAGDTVARTLDFTSAQ